MDDFIAINQIVEGVSALAIALGWIPTVIAAPLVIIAGGVGALLGRKKRKKGETEDV